MKTRVISACVLVIVVAACFIIAPITRALLLLAVMIAAIWEMCRALRNEDLNCPGAVLYVFAVAAALASYFGADTTVILAILFLAVFGVLTAGVCSEDIGAKGALSGLGVLIYPVLPLYFIFRLCLVDNWVPVFVLGCASAWICDCFALFGGSLFGKHKLCPAISPNKTVEGSITGGVFSVFAGVIIYFIFKNSYGISFAACCVTSLICSTLGQFGDLFASMIKRMTGIKDYSNLIPGHGGIMDRVDSLIFAIPAAYFCLVFFG